MDPYCNPYRPGAGTRPLILSGRQAEIDAVTKLYKMVKAGAPQRSIMFYGLRGVGKTVLLNEAERIAEEEGYRIEHMELAEGIDFRGEIAKAVRKLLLRANMFERAKDFGISALRVLKAFTIGIPDGPEFRLDIDAALGQADSGDLKSDLTDLFVALGEAARSSGTPVGLLIDEVQYLDEDGLAGLIAASHRISQKALPVVFICAGLPQIAALSGDARSYAERLFDFRPVENLRRDAATEALVGPARERDVHFAPDAVEHILDITEGYPYFIQEFGKHAWEQALASPITKVDAEIARYEATKALDASFFKVRIDRATTGEKRFLAAMAEIGSGPYRIADVAAHMHRKVDQIGPARATLIRKGFVYAPQHGFIDFTVPQFDQFARRFFDLDDPAEE